MDIQDVKDIEDILVAAGVETVWRCSESSPTSAPEGLDAKSPFMIKAAKVFKTSTLRELLEYTPRGRLFHFEAEAVTRDGARLSLRIGEPFKKARWLEFTSTADEAPPEFFKVVAVLERAERRGRKWHYLATGVLPNIVVFEGLWLYAFLDEFYAALWPEGSAFNHQAAAAAGVVFVSLISIPLITGVWTYVTASSVTLKPRFSAAPVWSKTLAGLKWIGSLYRKDELLEQKMLIVTTTSMFLTFISVIVAVLAWVLPRN